MKRTALLSIVLASSSLAACGGGGGAGTPGFPATNAGGSSVASAPASPPSNSGGTTAPASVSTTLGPDGASMALPMGGGLAAALDFASPLSGAGSTLTVSLSATPPAGVPQPQADARQAMSVQNEPIAYIAMLSTATVTFANTPHVTLTLASLIDAGTDLGAAFYDSSNPQAGYIDLGANRTTASATSSVDVPAVAARFSLKGNAQGTLLLYRRRRQPASPTPSPAPTVKPSPVPTVAPTAKPTAAPTAKPTAAPTATPAPQPPATPAPTPTPTAAPTATPTAAPRAPSTPSPTPAPTATPTPVPTASSGPVTIIVG